MGCGGSKGIEIADNNNNNNNNNKLVEENSLDEEIDEWLSTVDSLQKREDLREYAYSKDRKALGSKQALCEFIKDSPAKTSTEKAWVIYLWITKNISYNIQYLKDPNIKLGDPFLTGLSVCQGFSELGRDLCEAAGIKCRIITGWAKAFGYRTGDTFEGKKTDHAWNMIMIDGRWRFMECTWGEGYGTADYKAIKKFDPYYFLVPPRIFIYKHFPENSKDQLLSHPITLKQYEKQPMYSLTFFRLGFKLQKNYPISFEVDTNPFQIMVSSSNPKHSIICSLFDQKKNENIEKPAFVQYRGNSIEINVLCPKGTYELSLFGNETSGGNHDALVEYIVKGKSNKNKDMKWCKKYSVPFPVYLFEPRQFYLEAGKDCKFRLQVNGLKVILFEKKDGKDNRYDMKKVDEKESIWEISHKIEPNSTYGIYVQTNNSLSLDGLYGYESK